MALTYGFNVSQSKDLMEKIKSAYTTFGSNVTKEWEAVVKTLQTEWIGPDEQDFEKKFAERVSKMYAQAYDVIKNSIDNIVSLTNSWLEFQNKNSVTGEAIGTVSKVTAPAMPTKNESIVKRVEKTFTEKDDMGLANSNSASKISTEVKSFAKNLKSQSKTLFDEIQSNNAFFGNQNKKLDKYIEAVGDTMTEITVAVKDLDDALDTLAKSNYKTSVDNVSDSLVQAKSEISSLADSLGETRWK